MTRQEAEAWLQARPELARTVDHLYLYWPPRSALIGVCGSFSAPVHVESRWADNGVWLLAGAWKEVGR